MLFARELGFDFGSDLSRGGHAGRGASRHLFRSNTQVIGCPGKRRLKRSANPGMHFSSQAASLPMDPRHRKKRQRSCPPLSIADWPSIDVRAVQRLPAFVFHAHYTRARLRIAPTEATGSKAKASDRRVCLPWLECSRPRRNLGAKARGSIFTILIALYCDVPITNLIPESLLNRSSKNKSETRKANVCEVKHTL
jgi:hypothetical protein